MLKNSRKLFGMSFLAIALYSIFAYFFVHMAYMYINTETGLIFEYISLYISKATGFIVPTSIAAISIILYAKRGVRSTLLFSLVSASAGLIYAIPYYYIIFIYNYSYDSAESITLAIPSSILYVAVTVISAITPLFATVLVMHLAGKRKNDSFDVKKSLSDSLSESKYIFDFSNRANLVISISSLFAFAVAFISEIIDTVLFFAEYKLDYTVPELLTIICNYILLFIMLFASYVLGVYIKNKSMKETD